MATITPTIHPDGTLTVEAPGMEPLAVDPQAPPEEVCVCVCVYTCVLVCFYAVSLPLQLRLVVASIVQVHVWCEVGGTRQ